MCSASESSREGVHLPRRWLGADFIPFDEMVSVEGNYIVLSSGERRRLSAEGRVSVEAALRAPAPEGVLTRDAATWCSYAEGAWSPRRASRSLLSAAEALSASDIHIEAMGDAHQVRLRVSGELVLFASVPSATGRRLLAALKHLSGCMPYRSDLVQEGRIPRPGVAADVRASFMPTATGERGALRLFGRLYGITELGLPEAVSSRLCSLLLSPSGLVLIAGPSGGGKTTTVYAALSYLSSRRGGAHLSIEDPVEQRLRVAGIGVDQVELNPSRGLTAEAALVGALRQDVDVLALGEIRRASEAALALEAAHTGRLVVAGLHAGSAQEASQRMCDLGADPAVLRETLRGVLHQRLTTVPCPLGDAPDCPRCRGIGRVRVPSATLWIPESP